jgi:hypothetical protein
VTGGKDAGLVDSDGMEGKEEGVHGRERRGVESGSSSLEKPKNQFL